jgi:dienelactone hydrolase
LTSLAAPLPGPAGDEGAPFRAQPWLIPSAAPGVLMHATLFRPPGPGPFPLAVVNHGSDEDIHARIAQSLPSFPALTAWLVARGYAVLVPQRPGHGVTGGPYLEAEGSCAAPDYAKAGHAAAASIAHAVDFMRGQSFVRPRGIVVIGNSTGGWGALALAASPPAGVAAIVSFAGGRGGRNGGRPNDNCAPDRLVAAAGTFGAGEKLPTLWLYARNDSWFPPDLSARLAAAFTAAGGRAEYHLLPPIPGDGHALINTSGDTAGWSPLLAAFLKRTAGH